MGDLLSMHTARSVHAMLARKSARAPMPRRVSGGEGRSKLLLLLLLLLTACALGSPRPPPCKPPLVPPPPGPGGVLAVIAARRVHHAETKRRGLAFAPGDLK